MNISMVSASQGRKGHKLVVRVRPGWDARPNSPVALASVVGCLSAQPSLRSFDKEGIDRVFDTPPEATQPSEAELPPLGEKTVNVVFALLQDFYRQELAAEEDVHRTLPFFATALGLIVASLNYSATQLPSWSTVLKSCSRSGSPALSWHVVLCSWSVLLAGLFLLVVLCLSGAVLWYLALATRRRDYKRVGPEGLIVKRTRELHSYHVRAGLIGDGLDTTVMIDVRAQLLDTFSEVVPINRDVTLQRYHYRARAVLCLLWSLFFALLATILIIATAKFGIIEASP
jgi:hypothetical protein